MSAKPVNSQPVSDVMVSLTSVVRTINEQISSDLLGDVVILDLRNGVYYGLNAVGARVWQLMSEPRRVSEILGSILEEYDVDRARGESDILTLLDNLASKGLIRVIDDPAE